MKLIVLLLCMFFSMVAPAQPNKPLAIGVGAVGDSFYAYGSGLASVLSRAMGQPVAAEVTGGGVDNLRALNSGKVDLTLVTASVLTDAVMGRGRFAGDGPMPLRAMMVLYPNRIHAVTLAGNGIHSIKDLKGKRVSTGTELGVSSVIAPRILEAAGVTEKDYRNVSLERLVAAQALKDGKIDALFYASGDPVVEFTDVGLALGSKIKLLSSDQYVAAMNKKYGRVYARDTVRVRASLASDSSIGVVSLWTILTVHASMSDEMAYNIVKQMIARQADMIAINANARSVARENQSNENSPIPYHPGAIKYFAERGLNLK